MSDLEQSIKEITPLFGQTSQNKTILKSKEQFGFLTSYSYNHVIDDVVKYAKHIFESKMNLGSILLYSDNIFGTGKSTISGHITQKLNIDYTKTVSSDQLVMKDNTYVSFITK